MTKPHSANTKRLKNPKSFSINPFTTAYLANFFGGDSSPANVARVLVYSRALGTSISTTFGNRIQKFTSDVLGTVGSLIDGNDIEFTDRIDNRKKFCQIKAGPNNINKGDVKPIADHFAKARRRGLANNVKADPEDFIVGVVYGTEQELNSHYRKLRNKYGIPVYVGKDFWVRLTGDPTFYYDLIASIREVVEHIDFKDELDEIVDELAKTDRIIEIARGGNPV